MRNTSTFTLFFFFTALLGTGVASGDTFELLRHYKETLAFKTGKVNVAGQIRYRIQTEHYDITAYKLEDGNLVGERLEHLYATWELLAAEFLKQAVKEPAQFRHKVVLFRNKAEYVDSLRRIDPFIDRSNGFYYAPRNTAYFFSPETRVLFHEGTHQILAEHLFSENTPAFSNNFWITEGIALFMQTLEVEEQCYTIGNILDDRLFSAKVRQFEQNYKLPMKKLTEMSAEEIQTSADIDKIYSQSATLVHWLMFADQGRYRGTLFELLRQTYHGLAKPETLSRLTGLSYDELDVKYVEFLKTIPDEIEQKN